MVARVVRPSAQAATASERNAPLYSRIWRMAKKALASFAVTFSTLDTLCAVKAYQYHATVIERFDGMRWRFNGLSLNAALQMFLCSSALSKLSSYGVIGLPTLRSVVGLAVGFFMSPRTLAG